MIQDNSLDEVELTYEMPVTISGDTLVYNADSFNTGTERKLEDVLKNLPGVEINDDGQVEVEGKVVTKLMVEGKDFFDGDTKLATKNIPSNAVDKVQVLKNGERIAEIKGNISDVEVFPKSIVEWWLVPIKTGEFDDLHCYVKDKKTGKTHLEMGMVGTIIVY